MKIINLSRGQGKTTRLLYASEFNDIPILCATNKDRYCLIKQAEELGLKIPEPITISELTSGAIRGTDKVNKDILVDEAHIVLQIILFHLGMTGEIKAITLSEE